jgi:hypothetical protein
MGEIERLDEMAIRINKAYRRLEDAPGDRTRMLRVGELLGEAKWGCPEGAWPAWLEEHFEGSVETAHDLGKGLRAAWNAHDVEGVMALFADEKGHWHRRHGTPHQQALRPGLPRAGAKHDVEHQVRHDVREWRLRGHDESQQGWHDGPRRPPRDDGPNGSGQTTRTGAPVAEMAVSPEQAREIADAYVRRVSPGTQAGEAEEYYGYYTLHTEKDGEVTGMLRRDLVPLLARTLHSDGGRRLDSYSPNVGESGFSEVRIHDPA